MSADYYSAEEKLALLLRAGWALHRECVIEHVEAGACTKTAENCEVQAAIDEWGRVAAIAVRE